MEEKDKINVFGWVNKIVRKGESAGYQIFSQNLFSRTVWQFLKD